MARTNGDLDYDNWVLFFTGHGAAGGGSDLDQGDTRRDFFAQRHRRVRPGRLAARRRADRQRRAALRRLRQLHRAERPHRQLLPARRRRASWASQPGFQVPGNAPFFQPGFDAAVDRALRRPGHADRPEPDPRGEVRLDGARATTTTSRRASASRGSRRSRRRWSCAAAGASTTSAPAPATSATCSSPRRSSFCRTCRRRRTWRIRIRGSTSTRSRFRSTCGSAWTPTARRRWLRADGTPFPATEPFSAKSNVFIDPLLRTPYLQQWTTNVQYELRRGVLRRCRLRRLARRRPARQDQPRRAGRSARDAGQRLHRHLRPARPR